jgi:enoyl-CoA hydratase/carnithine racemase
VNTTAGIEAELYARRQGAVATISLDRAHKRNALTLDHWRRLAEVVGELEDDPAIRVVVLRSTNADVFCAGADIDEFRALRSDAASAAAYTDVLEAGVASLRNMRRPTVAVVQGKCLGGGLELLQACDIVIADESARIGLSPASLGVVYPYEATRRLVATWGARQARLMLYSGCLVTGARAHDLGVVAELCDADQIEAKVATMLAQIAAMSPLALASTKAIVAGVASGDRDGAASANELVAAALRSSDYAEGLAAFREKRQPRFEQERFRNG